MDFLKENSLYISLILGIVAGYPLVRNINHEFKSKTGIQVLLRCCLFTLISVVSVVMFAALESMISGRGFRYSGVSTYGLYLIAPVIMVATTTAAEYLDNVDWNSAAVRTMGKTYTYKVRGIYAADSSATGYSEIEVLYNPFEDVEEGTDEFTYIAWAYNYYIVNGTGKTTYSPEANCLRDQFCIMLYKLNGLPSVEGTAPFEDIATETSNTRKAIVWCYLEGIVAGLKGQPTVFNPRGDISRSQLAIMLYRMGGSPEVDITDLHFTDIASQTSNTKKAIVWCYQNGIIPSIDGDLFEPTKKGSRALLTEMMYQYDQIYHLSDELDLQH